MEKHSKPNKHTYHSIVSTTLKNLKNELPVSNTVHQYSKRTAEKKILPFYGEETTRGSSFRHLSPTYFSLRTTNKLSHETSTLPLVDDEESPSSSGYGRSTTRHTTQGISSTSQYGEKKTSNHSSTGFALEKNFSAKEPHSTEEPKTVTKNALKTSTTSKIKISMPGEEYGRRTTKKTDNISFTAKYEQSTTEEKTVDYNRRTTSRHGFFSSKTLYNTTTQTELSTTEDVDKPEYSMPQYGSLETSTKPPQFGSTSKTQTQKYSSTTLIKLENTQASSIPIHEYGKQATEKETSTFFGEETTTIKGSSRNSSSTYFSQRTTHELSQETSTQPLDDEEILSSSSYGRKTTKKITQGMSSISQFREKETITHSLTGATLENNLNFSTEGLYSTEELKTTRENEIETSTTFYIKTSTTSHMEISMSGEKYGEKTTKQTMEKTKSTLQYGEEETSTHSSAGTEKTESSTKKKLETSTTYIKISTPSKNYSKITTKKTTNYTSSPHYEDLTTGKQTLNYNRTTFKHDSSSHEPLHSTIMRTEHSTLDGVHETDSSTFQYGSLETSTNQKNFKSTSKKQTHTTIEAIRFIQTSFPLKEIYDKKTTKFSEENNSTPQNEKDKVSSTHFQTRLTHRNKLDFFTDEPYSTNESETLKEDKLETSTISHVELSTPVERYGRKTTKKTTDDISSTSQYEDSTTKKQTVEYNRRTTSRHGPSSHKPHQSTTTQTEPSTTEEVDESEYSTPQYGSLETSTEPPRFGSTCKKQTHKYSSSSTLEDLENTQPSFEPNHNYGKKTTETETLSSFGEETTTSKSSSRHSSPTSFFPTSTHRLPYEGSTQPLDDKETLSNTGYGRRTTRQTTQELSSTPKYEKDEVSSTHFQTRSTHGNKLDFSTDKPYSTEELENPTKNDLETFTSHREISTPGKEYGKTTKQTTDDISSTSQYEDSTTEKQTVDNNKRTTSRHEPLSHKPHQSTTTQTEPSTTEEVDESEYSTLQYGSLETSTKQQPSTTHGNNIKSTTSKDRFESKTAQQTHKPSYTTVSNALEGLEITNLLSTSNDINSQKTTKESYEDTSLTSQYGEEETSTHSSTHTTPGYKSAFSTDKPYSTEELENPTKNDLETFTSLREISTLGKEYGKTTKQTTDDISSTSQYEDSTTEKQTVDNNKRTTSRHEPLSHKPHQSTTTQTEPSTTEEVDESENSTLQYGSLETSTNQQPSTTSEYNITLTNSKEYVFSKSPVSQLTHSSNYTKFIVKTFPKTTQSPTSLQHKISTSINSSTTSQPFFLHQTTHNSDNQSILRSSFNKISNHQISINKTDNEISIEFDDVIYGEQLLKNSTHLVTLENPSMPYPSFSKETFVEQSTPHQTQERLDSTRGTRIEKNLAGIKFYSTLQQNTQKASTKTSPSETSYRNSTPTLQPNIELTSSNKNFSDTVHTTSSHSKVHFTSSVKQNNRTSKKVFVFHTSTPSNETSSTQHLTVGTTSIPSFTSVTTPSYSRFKIFNVLGIFYISLLKDFF